MKEMTTPTPDLAAIKARHFGAHQQTIDNLVVAIESQAQRLKELERVKAEQPVCPACHGEYIIRNDQSAQGWDDCLECAAKDELTQLRAENADLKRDRERMDWLERNGYIAFIYEAGVPPNATPLACIRVSAWNELSALGDSVREQIDAAQAKEGAK